MSTPDAAAAQPQQDPASQNAAQPDAAAGTEDAATTPPAPEAAVAPEAAEEAAEPVVVAAEREVVLQRSVRYGRLLIGGLVLGAVVAMLASLLFPVGEDADYTLGQAAGFMALIGGAIGLFLGGLLALILGGVARRSSGRGVAIQSDVR